MKARIASWADRLLLRLPDRLTGCSGEMSRRLSAIYGAGNYQMEIRQIKRRNLGRLLLLLLLALTLLVTAAVAMLSRPDFPLQYERPQHPDDPVRLPVRLEAEYEESRTVQEVTLQVRPAVLTERELQDRLQKARRKLPEMIAGKDGDLSAVTADLWLPREDPDTGVKISWYRDREDLMDEQGHINWIRAELGDEIVLTARLELSGTAETTDMRIVLGEPSEMQGLQESLQREATAAVGQISAGTGGAVLQLPERTESGVRLRWSAAAGRTPFWTGALLMAGLAFWVWKNRYRQIEEWIRRSRASVIRDLPDLIGKLLLLLNAGMVVPAALEKIAASGEQEKQQERFLYAELVRMQKRIREFNGSLTVELTDLAQRSGERSMMRFAALVTENLDRGSTLAEKLQAEAELLRHTRKKRAEEQGRLAEMRLILPMTLMLLTLILVTTAPAFLEI